MPDHPRRLSVLRGILAFSIVSTALHFAHNLIEIERYPQASWISNGTVQVLIAVSWPVLTAAALIGLRRYAAGDRAGAHGLLAVYALLPLATLGHFAVGDPDIPAFWYATIWTDALAGTAVLAFVAWSAASARADAGVTTRAR